MTRALRFVTTFMLVTCLSTLAFADPPPPPPPPGETQGPGDPLSEPGEDLIVETQTSSSLAGIFDATEMFVFWVVLIY